MSERAAAREGRSQKRRSGGGGETPSGRASEQRTDVGSESASGRGRIELGETGGARSLTAGERRADEGTRGGDTYKRTVGGSKPLAFWPPALPSLPLCSFARSLEGVKDKGKEKVSPAAATHPGDARPTAHGSLRKRRRRRAGYEIRGNVDMYTLSILHTTRT